MRWNIPRAGILSIAIFIIFSMIFVADMDAETEPNGSFDTAEAIRTGTTVGEVTSGDLDFFNVTVPPKNDIILKLLKTDSVHNSIYLDGFDEDTSSISVDLVVSYPGQFDTCIWYNDLERPVGIFLVVTGRGTYDLEVDLENFTGDGNDTFDQAHDLRDGTVSGSVHQDPVHGDDLEFFRMKVPADSDVQWTLKKTDLDESGCLIFAGYDGDRYPAEPSDIMTRPGGSFSYTWYNIGQVDKIFYLKLRGEASFNLTVETIHYERDGDDTFATAREVSGGTYNGAVALLGVYDDDVDIYRITVPPDHDLEVAMRRLSSSGDLLLKGYSSGQEELPIRIELDNYNEHGTAEWFQGPVSSSMLYLKISGQGSYSLDLRMDEFIQDENDEIGNATAIVDGTYSGSVREEGQYRADIDYYLLDIPAGSKYTIMVTAVKVQLSIDVKIFEGEAHQGYLARSLRKEGEKISVEGWTDRFGLTPKYVLFTGSGKYFLELEYELLDRDDNEWPETAAPLFDGTLSENVSNEYGGDVDWYRVELGSDNELHLRIQGDGPEFQHVTFVVFEGSYFHQLTSGDLVYSFSRVEWDHYNGEDTFITLYIKIGGQGSYLLNLTRRSIERDGNDDPENSTLIDEGRSEGKVTISRTYGDDVDFFRIVVPPMKRSTVLVRMGGEAGYLLVRLYNNTKVMLERQPMEITETGMAVSYDVTNTAREEISYFVRISGDGTYEILNVLEPVFKEPMDTDGDGVQDTSDLFPEDPFEWNDTDGDGYGDNSDAFPEDPSKHLDSDGDGYGDEKDDFPYDPRYHIDTDGDLVDDSVDDFPLDAAASVDSDADGHPDVWNRFMDEDDSITGLELDRYPDDPDHWKEEDNTPDITIVVLFSSIFFMIGITATLLFTNLRKYHDTKEE